jgi:hypothetical protein
LPLALDGLNIPFVDHMAWEWRTPNSQLPTEIRFGYGQQCTSGSTLQKISAQKNASPDDRCPEKYAVVRQRLIDRFGGVTTFTRSPAQGTTTEGGKTVHDEIVVFEVMTETLDASWWGRYRRLLEREFRQDEIIVRASAVTLL